jgi:superfamily II DNA or RNA helicase
MQSRDYQKKSVESLLSATTNTCIQLPTGTGKSVVAKEYIERSLADSGGKRLILAPNRTLCDNIQGYIPHLATVAYTGVEPDLAKPVLVSTYKSYGKYLNLFHPDSILIDECHHIPSTTIQKILKSSPGVIVHGLTATPNRLDGKGLYPTLRSLHTSPQISWFIQKGYLSDYQLHLVDCPLFSSGDGTDNIAAQEKLFGNLPAIEKTVELYHNICSGKTIIFATTISHGRKLENALNDSGVKAKFLSSKSPLKEREQCLNAFKVGYIDCLINVELFTEGFDLKNIQNVILCRFTYSSALYLQMVGRLLRPLPGVTKRLIDLTGNCYYHGTPKSTFEWSLHGQPWRENDNKSSVNHKCQNCGEDLVNKKYVIKDAYVCCTNCQHEQRLFNTTGDDATKTIKRFIKEKMFTMADLEHLDPEIAANFVKMFKSNKIKYREKLNKIVYYEGIPTGAKRRALIMLKVPVKTINWYLEDDVTTEE